jgi:outer membrane receptor protein involved in Fe transport
VDKSENYDVQISPGVSAVFGWKKNTIRWSGQTAFRSPTLQNQYILLDLGVIKLKGNLSGITNSYTQESVDEFIETYEETLVIDPDILTTYFSDPIKPEQVYSTEVGYRGVWFNDFYIDMNAYVSWYKNFIGDIRVVEPLGGAIVTEESGVDAILTDFSELIQYPTNARQWVMSYGGSFGVNYYIWKSLRASFNYTYSDLNTKNLNDPILPGFNTPQHKFNVGIGGESLVKGFGFSVRCKWVDQFKWESPFGDGPVPSYYTIDAQVNYTFDKFFTLQVGSGNITNNKHVEAYGSPTVGSTVYGAILFDMERK